MVSVNAVTALLVIPCCARRVVRVAPIIAKVKPDDVPRNSAASGAGSRYGRTPSGSLLRRPLRPVVILDRERRVVGKPLLLVDRHAPRGFRESGRADLVVDAPSDVLRPGLAAVRPPGVLLCPHVDEPEHVHPRQLV